MINEPTKVNSFSTQAKNLVMHMLFLKCELKFLKLKDHLLPLCEPVPAYPFPTLCWGTPKLMEESLCPGIPSCRQIPSHSWSWQKTPQIQGCDSGGGHILTAAISNSRLLLRVWSTSTKAADHLRRTKKPKTVYL